MRCYIAHMLERDAENFYTDIMKDLSTTFGKELYKNLRGPHITLKTPFEINSVEPIEELVSSFCQTRKSSNFTLGGFEHFNEKVIYLKVSPSQEMRETIKVFLSELKQINGILWNKIDNVDKIFHTTILKYNEIGNYFDDIFGYLKKNEVSLESKFSNISIIRFGNVYKTYDFSE